MESGRISPTNSSSIDSVSILVVDDDTTCLAIVAAILKKFQYEVVTVKHPNDALCTLRIKGGAFDLVVSDVHMPDMNGFELQRAIVKEFNLPVVLMSADDKEGVALKGLECGAAFFITKPVSPDDLRDLWQFAAMKRNNINVIETEKYINSDEIAVSSSSVNEDHAKRKSPKKERCDEKNGENSQSCSQKRPKIVWTNSLHNRFLEAIRSIGLDRAVPKKILEVMNVPGLTRENVASHLQKYRIFLRRVSDASYKIQYSSSSSSSHKGFISRTFKSNSESSRISTLMPNTLSKHIYQNPNLEATQSRLLSNRGSWQNPSVRTSNLVSCDQDDSPRVRVAQNYCGAQTSIRGHLANITLEDESNAMSHAFPNSTSQILDSLVARQQLCDVIADYRMPLVVQDQSALTPIFDISEFDMLSPQQACLGTNLQSQLTIQNKPQQINGGGSSNFYGDMLHWNNCVDVPYSFDQPQNQIQSNQLSITQGFTTSSQLNGPVLLPTNEQVLHGLANSLEFDTYAQLSKTYVVSPTHERNDDDFLESLLAPFAEDHSLEGSNM